MKTTQSFLTHAGRLAALLMRGFTLVLVVLAFAVPSAPAVGAVLALLIVAAIFRGSITLFRATLDAGYAQAIFRAGLAATYGDPVGSVRVDTTPSEHLIPDVSTALTLIRPNRAPLDTMLRLQINGEESVKAEKKTWETRLTQGRTGVIQSAAGGNTYASGDPATYTMDTVAIYAANDVLIAADHTTALQFIVDSVDTANVTITIYALDSAALGTVPSDLQSIGSKRLIRSSRARQEEGGADAAKSMMPTQDYNYVHLFGWTTSVSGTRKAILNYTTPDWVAAHEDAIWQFREGCNFQEWFGTRTKTSDPTSGNDRRTMGGATSFISSSVINYTIGSLTEGTLIDWHRVMFSDNNGSEERYLFTDELLQSELDKLRFSYLQVQRHEASALQELGIMAATIRSTFGVTHLLYDPTFEKAGKENYGVCLDLQGPSNQVPAVQRAVLRSMDYQVYERGKNAETDQFKEDWLEESTLIVRGGSEFHHIIQGTA